MHGYGGYHRIYINSYHNPHCKTCGGTGRIVHENLSHLCDDCNGTGIAATHARLGAWLLLIAALLTVAAVAIVALQWGPK